MDDSSPRWAREGRGVPRERAAFRKHRPTAPAGSLAAEAAGLRWLAAAGTAGGVQVVRVLAEGPAGLVLERLHPQDPSAAAAEEFGRRLAATHRSGAAHFGCAPDEWSGDGFIGPLRLPMVPGAEASSTSWAPFYVQHRVLPFARAAADGGALSRSDITAIEAACRRLVDEVGTGDDEPPSRLHGDLWAGNVVWTATGAVLIDPAAHGGHRETDLAMLALFGLSHLERVLAAYTESWPLAEGWRDRIGLHQLHPLLVHAVLFGSGYGARAGAVARRYV